VIVIEAIDGLGHPEAVPERHHPPTLDVHRSRIDRVAEIVVGAQQQLKLIRRHC
jgi:hypothetical protein